KAKAKTRSTDRGAETSTPSAPPASADPRDSAALKKFLEKTESPSSSASGSPQGGIGAVPGPGAASPGRGGQEGDLGDFLSEGDPSAESSELQYGEQASEPVGDDSDSGTAGAIVLGLLAGCVLFGLGLAVRRGWMRWRYGL
ncbi:MAG TPA: hypothetical protein VGK41_10255, partial [Solirubrobacterales bacterium]